MSKPDHTKELADALKVFVALADEHDGFGELGLADAIDGEGVAYPSQHLVDLIERARIAIRNAEASEATSTGGLTDEPAFGIDALMQQVQKRGVS